MKTLAEYLASDARILGDARVPPEVYRYALAQAAPIFREGSLRNAVPVTVINDPGKMESRKYKVVDMGAGAHGMTGTGGTFDALDQAYDDQKLYAMWKNVAVPWRQGETWPSLFADSVKTASEIARDLENEHIVKGLGPGKGIMNATGIQTFAGATWATAGNAWNDVTKAVLDKLPTKKVPNAQAALLVNPAEAAKLYRTFSNTAQTQVDQIRQLLPGGVFVTALVTAGEAYVYQKSTQVLEYVVGQDLSVVPLPAVDEDTRARVRVIGALHVPRPDGVVKITGIA